MGAENVTKHLREHNLEPPMYDWNPFFIGLPDEIKELIFSKFAFQLRGSAHNKADTMHLQELQRYGVMLEHPHPLNALAATSNSLKDNVESYCDHLLEKHRTEYRSENCPATPGETEKRSKGPIVSSTRRGLWLHHVADSCAFCGKDSSLVTLKTRPFNRLINSCGDCVDKQWPDKIELHQATYKHDISLHHLLWPPQGYVLQWGRHRYLEIEVLGPRGVQAPSYMDTSFGDYLLDSEVEALAKAVKSEPTRHIPLWAMRTLSANS
jgi:hypothetical protein